MNATLNKWIHLLILPCSKATMLIERETAGELSFVKRIRLSLHLYFCKWCRAYYRKVKQLDRILRNKRKEYTKESFHTDEIQLFKENIKKKMHF